MNKRNILKGASVLLIATVMILSTFAATANTNKQNADNITNLGAASQNDITMSSSIDMANFGGRDLLWDNGDTDGSNGYSHADPIAFGYHRTLLDDFVIPAGQTWTITDFHCYILWDTLPVGTGTDFLLSFWSDAGDQPGAPLVTATTVSYGETATGRVWFTRNEAEVDYVFEPIELTEGTYWIEGNVIGPENAFWMIMANYIGAECWINYEDLGGLMSGFDQFGAPAGLSFKLTGTGGGPPEVPDLDCDGVLNWEDIEPGATVTGSFTVENIGDPGSMLDWEIESYPDWGTWTFDPESGTGLAEGDSITVQVEVVAPEEGEELTGEVKIVNSDDPDDFCIIDAAMTDAVSQQSLILEFLEILAGRFPIIAQILAAIL